MPNVEDIRASAKAPLNILIIDDEPLVRQTLGAFLAGIGPFATHEAENALEGLTLMQKVGRVDGVLVDINMPGMDGIEFIRRVKELDRSIVAVVITGYPSADTIIQAMRAGASDFLAKPFTAEQLSVSMQRLSRERDILLENLLLTQEVKTKKALEEINLRLERKIKEQAILFAISDTLSTVMSTYELYQKVVQLACSLTESPQALFWVINQEAGRLYLMGAQGPYEPSWEEIAMDASPELPSVRVAKEGMPILLSESSSEGGGFRVLVPFKIRNEIFGVLSVRAARNASQKGEEILFLLHLLAERASLSVENLLLYESVSLNLHATLRALVRSLEAKDPYTRQHSQRVTHFAVELAARMHCSQEDLDALRFAGYLHDIGKIGIRDQILMKPGPLTAEEYEVLKTHPVVGEEIVGHLGLLPMEKAIIRHHHERWDGLGYPDQLKAEAIPRLSRILAVADTFDAITTCRPYRNAGSVEDAFGEIRLHGGTQFDPEVVACLGDYVAKDRQILDDFMRTIENEAKEDK